MFIDDKYATTFSMIWI